MSIPPDRSDSAEWDGPLAARHWFPLVYDELRRLAARRMVRESPGQTLSPTALVHEAYLRLVGDDPERPWQNRAHFFTAAAESIRRILVENARRRHALKRGGGRGRQDLDLDGLSGPLADDSLLALDEALDTLAAHAPLKAEVVKLRFFSGLTVTQVAEVLGISVATAERYWAYSRAWLRIELSDEGEAGPEPGARGIGKNREGR